MTISTSYSRLENDLPASSQKKEKFKTKKDWSFDIHCKESKYDGVSIPARKHAITVVVLNKEVFFSFNATYTRQTKEACKLFSETMKKYIENSNSVKVWKILPYKKVYKEPSRLIDKQIKEAFPKANIDSRDLKKDCFFLIDHSGNETSEYKPEAFYGGIIRSIKKAYSILSCQEDKFKVS